MAKFGIQFIYGLRAVINKYKALKVPLEKILINLDNIMNNHFNKKCYYYVHKVEDLSDIVNNMSKIIRHT